MASEEEKPDKEGALQRLMESQIGKLLVPPMTEKERREMLFKATKPGISEHILILMLCIKTFLL